MILILTRELARHRGHIVLPQLVLFFYVCLCTIDILTTLSIYTGNLLYQNFDTVNTDELLQKTASNQKSKKLCETFF